MKKAGKAPINHRHFFVFLLQNKVFGKAENAINSIKKIY